MTEIEARGKIKWRISTAGHMVGFGEDGKAFEDLEIALQVMKEIREYRELGTVEEIKSFFNENRKAGYNHGYSDGYAKAIDEFAENLRPLLNTYADRVRLDEVAEYLKGGATDERTGSD